MAHLRPIDKEFEDADDTGILVLSGRSLRNFPLIPGELCNLGDVFEADFSRNRMDRIPDEVCTFHSLVKLKCYHNSIRHFPDRFCQLANLRDLDLSRNFLQQIPSQLCWMTLHSLNLRDNRLVSLPLEFGKLKQLRYLDLSCNILPDLPPSLIQMTSLQHLDLHRNELKELPHELHHLPLTYLDISSNSLSRLPNTLRHIETLNTFVVRDNPLMSPPTQVCIRGLIHIFKYLESMEKRGSDPHLVYNRDEMSSLRRRNNKMKRSSTANRPVSDSPNMGSSSSTRGLGLVDEIANQLMGSNSSLTDGQVTPTGTMHWSVAQYLTAEEQQLAGGMSDQSKEEYREAAHRLYMQQERQKGRQKLHGIRSSSPPSPSSSSTSYPPPHSTQSSSHYGTLPKRKDSSEEVEPLPPATAEVRSKPQAGPGRSLPNESYRRSGSWNSHMRRNPVLPSKYSTPPAERANRVEDKSEEEKETERQQIKETLRDAFKEGKAKLSSKSAGDIRVVEPHKAADAPPPPKTKTKTKTKTKSKPPPLDATPPPAAAPSPSRTLKAPDSPGSDRDGSITPTNESLEVFEEPLTPKDEEEEGEVKVKRGLPPLQPVELTEEPLPPTAIHNSHSADDLLAGGPPREAASDHAPSDHTPSDHQHKLVRPLSYTESVSNSQMVEIKPRPPSTGTAEGLSLEGTWPRAPSPRLRGNKDVFRYLQKGQDRNFTVHRQEFQMKRILEKNQSVKQSVEQLMGMTLTDDMGEWVSDGVILCQVVNKLHPGTIHSIHLPQEGQELSVIHRTRNLAAFIQACRALNVPQEELCSAGDIIEFKDPARVIACIQRVLDSAGKPPQLSTV